MDYLAMSIAPLVNGFENVPFLGFILFIGLSAFTRNTGLSRFVRFNIQQALILDIALLIPSLFSPLRNILPTSLAEIGCNFIFYSVFLTIGYSWFMNLQVIL